VVYLKPQQPTALWRSGGSLPDIALLTPKVDQVGNASGSNQSDSLPSREIKPIRKTRPVEEQANSSGLAGTAI
jgi:hypothetical protein